MPRPQKEEKEESNSSSGRSWWLTGAIVVFVLFLFSRFLGFGYYLGGFSSLILLAGAVVLLIIYFSHKTDKKIYKANLPPEKMKIQYIFYTVGVLFIFASVWYFAREFIDDLPDSIKLILLIVAVVVTFIIAELLRGSEK